MNHRSWRKTGFAAGIAVAGMALLTAACGGGTSSSDKTATAAASGGAKTVVATKAPATAVATSAATGVTTPLTGATTGATAAAGATQPSGTTGAVVAVADSPLGKILVDSKGFTLYTFSNDVAGSGKSAAEALTAAWPPLSLSAAPSGVTGATGAWSVFTRADGKTQVAYKGMPLYYFANDKAPGDTKGDKVGGVWFVAIP